MYQRMVLVALCALIPSIAWAQTGPAAYLPSKSQFYFHWDGMRPHQAAFDKTACGQMVKGDTGKFLVELWKYIEEQIQIGSQSEPKVSMYLGDATKLMTSMRQDGLVMGIEVEKVMPPQAQAVLVFPKTAGESGTLLQLIDKIGEEANAEVKRVKVGKRFVHSVDLQFLKIGWWGQGQDAVLYVGTSDPEAYARDIDANKAGLANHPLYKEVASFKDFTTCSRGYFDMASALNVASEIKPEVGQVIDVLGIKGIKSITFATGFDGLAERSVADVAIPGPRTGLLSFGSGRKMSLKDLPALPNDITGFGAGTIKLDNSYDLIVKLVDGVVKVVAPNEEEKVKEAIKSIEGTINVDLDKEFFANFGNVAVSYSSPSEGFLWSGMIYAVQIKDGKKMSDTLSKLVKAIPPIPNPLQPMNVVLKKKPYRGGEIMQLQLASEVSQMHIASIGIYKNWLIYSNFPQPVKGFIMRQEGDLPVWKADDALTKALAQFPAEFNSIKISDPRPGVQATLAFMPFLMNAVNSGVNAAAQFVPGLKQFDLDLIPHAQDASRHLFPNVTIGIDDGKRFRTETRTSLGFPF